jgi:hypothetical protein
VIRALRPALSTIPGAPLLCASSTYDMTGVLYEAFVKHHGKDKSPVMVWKADTLTMNPSFRQEVIDAAYEQDAAAADAEYGSEWLSDVRQHFPDELVDAAIVPERRALVRAQNVSYAAFVDPSGGVHDDMVLSVAHHERGGRVVLDRLEAVRPPFQPEEVCQRFADILSGYGLDTVTGDRYGSTWVTTMFRKFGVVYKPSELDKSQIYIQAQPLFSQRVVELLDIPKLSGELRRLERRPRAGGRDLVDHPRGGRDDSANAAVGALLLASKQLVVAPGDLYGDVRELVGYQGRRSGFKQYDPYKDATT